MDRTRISKVDAARWADHPPGGFGKAIAKDAAALDAWMNAQKEALKTGRLDQALSALAGHTKLPK